MKVSHLTIENFRGIRKASLLFPDHVVLIGDNNVGKTTVLEAIDLVLGPDRLSRRPPVDEHDFHLGKYLLPPKEEEAGTTAPAGEDGVPEGDTTEKAQPQITIEATVTGLSEEQLAHFHAYIEWWDSKDNKFYDDPKPEGVDAATIAAALRVKFIGKYDAEEDDFEGNSYYSRSLEENEKPDFFTKKDKQRLGFLYLRSLRTGSRALRRTFGRSG